MNLPNKLTVMRVCLIPFFVLFMLADLFGTADRYIGFDLYRCQPDGSVGWQYCQKIQSGYQFR